MKRICISCDEDDSTGYGRMGRQIRFGFERRGFQVDQDPGSSDAEVVVFVRIPPQVKGWRTGARAVLFTMYETDDLPWQYRGLRRYSNVLVPSKACAEAFSRWHPNVDVVPLGVDDRWEIRSRPVAGPFTFLTSGHERRKGWDATIAAFRHAFPDQPDVRLIVKAVRPSVELRAAVQSDPRISLVDGNLSAAAELDLYGSAHCYVGLSRGEGFGLMPLQALRSGCPIIISAGHGHAEYARYADAVVPTTLVPSDKFSVFDQAGRWWEPDVDAAAREMRRLFDRYDDALSSVAERAGLVADLFTWDRTVEGIIRAVGGDFGSVSGDGWETPSKPLVGFSVRTKLRADIGPWRLRLEPGETYWYPANVYRMLADGGWVTDEEPLYRFDDEMVTA